MPASFCMLRGELRNGTLREPVSFSSYSDLALKLDDLFRGAAAGREDIDRSPHRAFSGGRDPAAETPLWDESVIQGGWGRRGNFLVNVYARQNESWQGSVRWIEGKEARYFRSMWELICLIEGALNGTELPCARKGGAELPEPAARRLSGNAPIVLVQVRSVLEYAVVETGSAMGLLRTVGGEFYNGCFSQGLPFLGLDDLVMKLDGMFDYLDFPQSGEVLRAFGRREKLTRYQQAAQKTLPPLEQAWDRAMLRKSPEAYDSFHLYVCTRGHAGWQGIIQWRNGFVRRFGSVLQLLRLIENGLDRELSARKREAGPLVRGALG